MDSSQELSEYRRSTVIGLHLCNKSSREISLPLNIPQSTVSGIITKWKRLGMTAAQPRSGRPRKMTERGQLMLRRRGRQLSAEWIATDLQTSCGFQISSRTVRRELYGMGFHGWATASKSYITKCNAKCRMQGCKACCHWSLEQWRQILNLAIWWTSLGLAVARRTVLVWLHSAKCKVWWRGNYGVGLLSRPQTQDTDAGSVQLQGCLF